MKEKWGKLTDDNITQISGKREQFEGKIQERYGIAKDQERKALSLAQLNGLTTRDILKAPISY